MRILLCLNRDFMSNLALNQLWPALRGHGFDIVLSRGIGGKNASKAAEIEQWQALEHQLIERGLFLLLEERAAAGQFQSFSQMARATRSKQIREFHNINEVEGLAYVQQFEPDLIVSIRFGQIFKPPVIAVPRLGIINLHSGVLPDYRGVLATFWAMLMGESHIGCTLHYVTDGTIDTGEIVGTHRLPPNGQRSLLWNVASLYGGGTALIEDALLKLAKGQPIKAVPQDPAKGRYFSYPGREQVAQFLKRGHVFYSKDDYSEIFQWYGVNGAAALSLLSKIFPH